MGRQKRRSLLKEIEDEENLKNQEKETDDCYDFIKNTDYDLCKQMDQDLDEIEDEDED